MVKVLTHTLTELTIMEIGSMIGNTVWGWSHGQMERNMRELTLMVRKKVKENSLSQMEVITRVNSNRTKFVDTASTIGPMVNNTKVSGIKTCLLYTSPSPRD